MGVVLFLILFGVPAGVVVWIAWKIESSRPVGGLTPVLDRNGNRILGDDNLPLYVDERGKIFGYKYVKRFVEKRQRASRLNWIFLGLLWGMLEEHQKRGRRK